MGACYPWEGGEGVANEAPFDAPTVAAGGALRRAPSVDDLFAPLWRLEVRTSGLQTLPNGSGMMPAVAPTGTAASGSASLKGMEAGKLFEQNLREWKPAKHQSASKFGFATGKLEASVEDAYAHLMAGMPPSLSSYGLNGRLAPQNAGNTQKSWGSEGIPHAVYSGVLDSSNKLATVQAHGQSMLPNSPEKPSTVAEVPSDEDQLGLDEKKQKRMLSNRESARRSRLRKQHHLEELRSQLFELRAQNSEILGKLSIATQEFAQLNHDNQVLRMHAIELSRQLQHLHHKATAHHPDGLQAFGFGTSHLDPPGVAVGTSSAYTLVSDVLQGGMQCL